MEYCKTKKLSPSQKIIFPIQVDRWNRLDPKDNDSETVDGFKSKMEWLRNTKTGFLMDLFCQASWLHWIWATSILVWPQQVNNQVDIHQTQDIVILPLAYRHRLTDRLGRRMRPAVSQKYGYWHMPERSTVTSASCRFQSRIIVWSSLPREPP